MSLPLPAASSSTCAQHHADFFSVVQISDLHLFENPHHELGGLNHYQSFQQVLSMLHHHRDTIDLLMVTGDLVHEVSDTNYQQVFALLDSLDIPYWCIAGNHDVTQELDNELPFSQRRHIPMPTHPQLVNCQRISLSHWDLLLLDTSVAGHIYGRLSQNSLDWLRSQLEGQDRPCAIFAHHPMLPINVQWIDSQRLQNSTEFWEVVTPFADKLKAVFVGHVHQESHVMYQGIQLFSTPSTCVQFAPFKDDFTIDMQKSAGFRWITLYNNGNLATGIKRIDTM